MQILIKNGRVIDPANNVDGRFDVLLKAGKVALIGKGLKVKADKVIDASSKVVVPGLIDMHSHLRDPGKAEKETIASGTRAAALGGFTSLVCMANTDPPADNPAVIKYIVSKAKNEGIVNVFPAGAVTKGLAGEILAEMGMMREVGAVAFSDDGHPIMNAAIMRHALEYTSQFGLPVISHCQDLNLTLDGDMNESYLSTIIGLSGMPDLSEEIMVFRDVQLARDFGSVHIAHVSTAGSVEIIRKAKKEGISVTAETAPHYFSLTEDAVKDYDTNAKMYPPLRSEKDRKAIIKGLKDGTIDVIATDHAPHTVDDKNVEFKKAAFGIVGLETAVSLILDRLVHSKALDLKEAVAKLTVNPARILKLKKGTLSKGADADVTIIDLNKPVTVDASKFASKGKNTPFDGWKLKGAVDTVIVGGKIVVEDGQLRV